MYSLILMSAMTTAPDTAQFNGYFRDLFSFRGNCSGCTGCHGCDGFGSRIRSFFSFGGGCCGGSCHGASCHGGCTGRASNSCYGSSCYGNSCFGSQLYSCLGGMTYSDAPIYGAPIMGSPYPSAPLPGFGEPRAPIRPTPAPEIEESRYGRNPLLPDPKTLTRDPGRATVTVKAPADGAIACDGLPLQLTNGERTFVTPSLPLGQTYEYTFKLDYRKDGERRSREKTIKVRAGGTSVCDFTEETSTMLPVPPSPDEPKAAVKMIPSADPMKSPGLFPIAAQVPAKGEPKSVAMPESTQPGRARFSVRLPAEAVLYVDGRKTEKTGPRREFSTPVLPAGQEFKYELKAEIPGPHGYPQSVSTTVSFKAGETVPELNFDELLRK
jgi:uncharacterized protein (TIGR03000 family)